MLPTFTEEQRRIFGPYWNGVDSVFADPLRVHRRLHEALDGQPNKYLEDYRSQDVAGRAAARERLVQAALYALEMVPFDPKSGQGALEEDAMAALSAYLRYMEGKGGRVPSGVISAPPMGQGFSASAGLITPPMSPSGPISRG